MHCPSCVACSSMRGARLSDSSSQWPNKRKRKKEQEEKKITQSHCLLLFTSPSPPPSPPPPTAPPTRVSGPPASPHRARSSSLPEPPRPPRPRPRPPLRTAARACRRPRSLSACRTGSSRPRVGVPARRAGGRAARRWRVWWSWRACGSSGGAGCRRAGEWAGGRVGGGWWWWLWLLKCPFFCPCFCRWSYCWERSFRWRRRWLLAKGEGGLLALTRAPGQGTEST
ncbi:hypothetical protein B0J12DRAFT_221759 [Macrophomina phaseolina]|uniref:Uncharacterized protein n=1 Tax=Macrophomina phaseolina TaxID=35725 RepID=A0ABQ8G3F6_9PEZI|nr:hypothetical protein B0J12DRAFT_221759 [Macrophomina phaseolina]